MSRFVNAIVVGVVVLVVLSGAIFYFVGQSGSTDDGEPTTTTSTSPSESPSPTSTTEPSPTNTTGTSNNTTSPTPTGNATGNNTTLGFWFAPPWATMATEAAASVLWMAPGVEVRDAGGPLR